MKVVSYLQVICIYRALPMRQWTKSVLLIFRKSARNLYFSLTFENFYTQLWWIDKWDPILLMVFHKDWSLVHSYVSFVCCCLVKVFIGMHTWVPHTNPHTELYMWACWKDLVVVPCKSGSFLCNCRKWSCPYWRSLLQSWCREFQGNRSKNYVSCLNKLW